MKEVNFRTFILLFLFVMILLSGTGRERGQLRVYAGQMSDLQTDTGDEAEDTEENKTNKKDTKIEIGKAKIYGITSRTYSGQEIIQKKLTVKIKSKTLTKNRDYKVTYSKNKKVGTAQIKFKGIGNYTGVVTRNFKIIPKGTKIKNISAGSEKITITWRKQSEQTTGYKLQYSIDKTFQKYSKTITVKDVKNIGKVIKKLDHDTPYYFRIRTYRTVGDRNYYSAWSTRRRAKTKGSALVKAPSLKFVDWAAGNKLSIRWTKVDGADGYILYRSTSEYGTFQAVQTNKGGTNVRSVFRANKNKIYYYQVRAYRYKNNRREKSDTSNTVASVKYKDSPLGYLFPDGPPTSQSEMNKYLTTVSLPIRRSNGTKGTIRLSIHRKLSKKVKVCFEEMYEAGFQVRESDTGSFNWRKMRTVDLMSHHSYGCVVDINWNANPMVNLSHIGHSAYEPGRNKYSITKQVVEIWKRQGFYWGGDWTEKKDYMHITYTNN